jgi:cleavage and polyadenylation specificity factor subunit 1
MLEGINFAIYTDHKPLVYALQKNLYKASRRQVRYLDFIAQFTTDLRLVPGTENIVADMLSRIQAIGIPQTIDNDQLALEQDKNEELKKLLTGNHTRSLIVLHLN